MENGLDGSHITSIGLCVLEKAALEAGDTEATIFIDNIKAVTEETVAFDVVTFEEGGPTNYYVSSNDTTSEIVNIEGNKALKITALTTDATWANLSILGINASPNTVWNFSEDNLKFDITNPNDYDVPIARITSYNVCYTKLLRFLLRTATQLQKTCRQPL